MSKPTLIFPDSGLHFLLAVLSSMLMTAIACAGETGKAVSDVKVAYLGDAGRYSSDRNLSPEGFEPQLFLAATRLSARTTTPQVALDIDHGLALLQDGAVDALAGVPLEWVALQGGLQATAGYRTERYQLWTMDGSLLRNSSDPGQAKIALPAGSWLSNLAAVRGLNVVKSTSWEEAFQLVESGAADAVLADPGIALEILNRSEGSEIHPLAGVFHESKIVAATLAGSAEAQAIEQGLRALKQTGHQAMLERRWELAGIPATQSSWEPDYRTLSLGLLVLLAAILVLTRKETRSPFVAHRSHSEVEGH